MLDLTVRTKNVKELVRAFTALKYRSPYNPGFLLIEGEPGVGKTTSCARYLCKEVAGIYLSLGECWSRTDLLEAIAFELGQPSSHRLKKIQDSIIRVLAESRAPIFIDEADFLFKGRRDRDASLAENLRKIHDDTGSIIVLIGLTPSEHEIGIARKIARFPQLNDRIGQRVLFSAADVDDVRSLIQQRCEVQLEEEVIHFLHKKHGGNLRRIVVDVEDKERHARSQNWKTLNLAQYKAFDDRKASRTTMSTLSGGII